MERMTSQPVSGERFIAIFQIMQQSGPSSRQNLHALDFLNTLEQRIPRHAVLDVM